MSSMSQESTASTETFGKDASIKLSQLIGSMSISPSGRDVVLGSKEGLHVIDLDSPHSPPRFLPHRTPWEVADVQWSPFAERDYWVVSTSNQKALVWNLAAYGLRNSIEFVLHGHTRAITDINFSAHHPDKLATCAVDSFVHCWDLRCPAKPVNSFSDWFAGATQVKWSRQDEHVVASSHDKFLHIWDDRYGARPARTFAAHDAKIYGIDWNRFEPSKIVTCSLDKTVKFWDTNNDESVPDRVIETSFPVWRARHTPFGWGLMVMPQRGDGNLHLYDRRPVDSNFENGLVEPVQSFEGHKGQVKEFLWRPSGTVIEGIDHRDFQLVSWGTDRELKLHAVSKDTFLRVGYEKGVSKPQRLRFTRRGARNRTFRDEPIEPDTALAAISRQDPFPAQNQFLRARGRPSTNFGMSRVPVAQFKGWLQAGKRGRRTDMHGKGVSRPQTDPIAWMRNVKIADALADEITQVGDKFKKVDFESVNVSQRRATMSLQSPWGEQGASVYTRLDFKFPKGYPKTAQAIIHVAKTNSITADTQKKLASDVHKIAEVHADKGRGCIEATIRFLLRDQTLDQVINWMTRDSLTESKILDEANIPQDASDDSEDDQIDALPNITSSSANVRVPLAKGCAGLWAENGKLVCFFLPKQKEPASFLSTLGTGRLDDSESSKLFGGFGKFQVDSPSRKTKDNTRTLRDGSDSDSSDDSSMFSSSTSSSESSVGFEARARFVPWQRTTLDSLQKGRSAEGSQKSTTFEGTRAGELFKSTKISIFDLSNLLPAKESLAVEYKIHGDTFGVCQHNAEVASRYALHENASLWRIAAKVLVIDTLQQTRSNIDKDSELLSLLKQWHLTQQKRTTSHTPSGGKVDRTVAQLPVTEDVFGQSYLIPAIMQYLDQRCDVQMLAMMSAVFLQSKKVALDSILKLPSLKRQESISAPSFLRSNSYANPLPSRNSDARFGGLRHGATFNLYQPQFDQTDSSQDSRLEMSTSVPLSTMHTGFMDSTRNSSGAPNVVAHDPSGFISAIHSTVVSVAGSPESHRLSRKSEGSVAYPVATASLHALARSRPPSPPSNVGNKESGRLQKPSKSLRASPDDSFFNDARSRLKSTLSLVNVPNAGDETPNTLRGSSRQKSILKGDKRDGSDKKSRKRLRTRFLNPSHLKNSQSIPLAELVTTAKECLQYMYQYLPLLESWQLWIQKAEIHHVLAETISALQRLESGRSTISPKNELTSGLEVRRCCSECGRPLAPIEKNGLAIGWHCISTDCLLRDTRPTKKQKCSICDAAVEGLSVPCLQCGHLTCYDCAQTWFVGQNQQARTNSVSSFKSMSDKASLDQEEVTCPTGCGCSCPLLSAINVPDPEKSTEHQNKTLTTPTTPRSEGFPEGSSRTVSTSEHRTHRGQSIHGPESALNALLALNMSSRHRSLSSTQNSTVTATNTPQPVSATQINTPRTRDNSISIPDELLPWANDKNNTLGRGLGGGLSRGLSNKGSDSTIRRSGR